MADTDVQSNDVDNLKAAAEDGGATDGSPKDAQDSKDGKPRPPPVDIAAAQNAGQDGGIKTPTNASQTPKYYAGPSRYDTFRDKERKIGHRRVDEGGVVTYKKIGTNQLMGSIQLGIQQAVGSLASKPELDVLIQDFYVVETIFFPNTGSQSTPAHQFSDFRFKVYAPIAFRHFRDLFRIQPEDYLVSLCTEPLRELSNPGASGSIFYLTNDDEFIIKTVQHKEAEFLQKLLPGYYMNLNQNPRTLLPKFFGLYNYQCNAKNIRLITMNNLLPSSIKMHQRYDLKGSTYKRKANKYERSKDSPTFKDLDFMEHHPDGILLEAETYKALVNTIARDCRVLTSFKIMDYSLLVGIHNLDLAAKKKAQEKERRLNGGDGGPAEDGNGEGAEGASLTRSRSINRHKLVAHSTAMESIQADSDPIDEEDQVPPGGIPARNAKGERLLLFLGIIDILQSFRLKKKLEHTFKSMIHDGDTISVHRPTFYAQRFLKFMEHTVFKRIPSPLRHSPSRRRGTSLRMLRPMSQSEPEHTVEGHDSQEGVGGRLPGGSVSAEDRPGESGEVAISLSMATGGSGVTTTVTTPSAVAGAVSSGGISGAAAGGGGSTAASLLGSGTPSTPVNLPAVLQDRPHSGRGRVPPPVPPRSPRGGASQATPTSSSFLLSRGGVTYLTLPPSPRFAGSSPRFSHLCSPSIGMTGYNIWHADSMCRLDKNCMMPMLHAPPCERQHQVWQLPTKDVLALSPMHSDGATHDETPQKRTFRSSSAEAAIHAMRGMWDVIMTASRPGTPLSVSSHHPSDEIPNPSSHDSHLQSYKPSCEICQHSVDQNKYEFVLPNTHITSTSESPPSRSVVQESSPSLVSSSPKHSFSKHSQNAEQDPSHHCSPLARQRKFGQASSASPSSSLSRLPDDILTRSDTNTKRAIFKSPSPQEKHITSMGSSQESEVLGRKNWGGAQEFTPYNDSDVTRHFCENTLPLTRKSFAGRETLQFHEDNRKRYSVVDRPSASEEAYIEHALAMYLTRSRSPSPFKDQSSSPFGNPDSPHYGESFPHTSSCSYTPPSGHLLSVQICTAANADLCHNPSLSPEIHCMSSPSLLRDSNRCHISQQDDWHQSSPVLQRTFLTEI